MAEEIFNQSAEGTKQLNRGVKDTQLQADVEIQAEFAKANRFIPVTRNPDGSFDLNQVEDSANRQAKDKRRYLPVSLNEDGNFTILRPDANEDYTGINDLQRGQIKINEEAFDNTTPSTTFEEFKATFEKQAVFLSLLANGYGLVSDEDIVDFAADRSVALHNAQVNAPEYVKKFRKEFEAAKGFYASAAVVLANPRVIGRLVATQAPNSALPLMAGFVGGAIGSAVPFVGSLLGFAAGTFAGGSIVEIGAWMDQQIQAKGVDITDRDQLLTILQDDKFMENLIREAERKGLSTAAVDTLFSLFGGRLLAGAGKGIAKKAVAAAGDVALESVGEGLGEAAGQFAAVGKVDVKESFLEAVAGLGQSGGQTLLGFTFRQTKAEVEKVKTELKKIEKETTDTEKIQRGVEETKKEEVKKEEKDGKKEEAPKAKAVQVEEGIPKLKGLASEVVPLSTQTTVKRKDISGRITKLDTDIRQIDKDIDNLKAKQESKQTAAEAILKVEIKALIKEIETNKKAGRKTSALEQRLEKKQLALNSLRDESQIETDNALIKALAERDVLDEERAGLLTAEDLTKVDVSGKRVELNANEVKGLQVQIVKNKIRDVLNGIKKGKQIARAEMKDIQNTLTAIILASETNETSKKNALKAIQGIQTEAQFEKAAPKLIEKLDAAAEKFAKRKLIDNFKKMTKSKALDKLAPDIKKQIQAILDEFSATKPSTKKVEQLQTLADQLIAHDSNVLTGEQIHALSTLQKTPLSDMPLEDVQLVHDSVAHLLKINQDQDTIRVENRKVEKEKVIGEAVNNIKKKFGELDGNVDGMDSTQIKKEDTLAKALKWLKTFAGVESYNMELNAEILDGEDNGIMMKVFYNGIDNGEARKLAFEHFAEDFFVSRGIRELTNEGWSAYFTKEVKDSDKVQAEISSGTITMTKGERISFLLHAKNENSRRHLTEGGYVFRANPDADPIVLTDEDLATIEQSAGKKETQVADMIHEYFNSVQKQGINNVSVGLLGFEIAIEPNYFPLSVDRNALDREEQVQDFEKTGAFTQITIEGQGIFKKRVKSGKPIYISDAFEVTRDNIQKASAYIGLAEPLRNAKSLARSPEFQSALRKAGLKPQLDVIQKYLIRVEGESVRNDNADKMTQEWINRLDVAILGGNPYIWMKQPVSYLLAASEINIKHLASSFSFSISETEMAEILKWSPHFRDRFQGNISRETGEVASVGRTRKFWLGKEVISQKLMQPLRAFDKAAIGSIWRATKKEVAASHPNLKGDAFFEKVAERAWIVARRTQPTFAVKDRSTIGMTKNTWLRLATKYSSQRNKNWMMMRRAFEVYNRTKGTVSDDSRMKSLASKLVLMRVVAPLMIAAINALAATGRRDEGEDKEKALSEFVFDYIKTTFGDIFVISPVIGEILGQIERGKGRGFGLTDPLTGELESIVDLTMTLSKAVQDMVSDDNYKDNNRKRGQAAWKAGLPEWFLDSLDVSSKVTGMPASGYLRFILKTKNQLDKALDWDDNSDKIGNARFR